MKDRWSKKKWENERPMASRLRVAQKMKDNPVRKGILTESEWKGAIRKKEPIEGKKLERVEKISEGNPRENDTYRKKGGFL